MLRNAVFSVFRLLFEISALPSLTPLDQTGLDIRNGNWPDRAPTTDGRASIMG